MKNLINKKYFKDIVKIEDKLMKSIEKKLYKTIIKQFKLANN